MITVYQGILLLSKYNFLGCYPSAEVLLTGFLPKGGLSRSKYFKFDRALRHSTRSSNQLLNISCLF